MPFSCRRPQATDATAYLHLSDMIYEHDWIMRQIDAIAIFIAGILRGGKCERDDIVRIEEAAAGGDGLYRTLKQLASRGEICEAENTLYRAIEDGDPDALPAGMLFYFDINRMGDDELEAADFSREEVLEGIENLGKKFDLPMDYINK